MRCHFALLDEPKKEIMSYGQDDDLQRPHHRHISHMSFSNLYFDLEKGCRLIWSHRTMQFQVSYIEKAFPTTRSVLGTYHTWFGNEGKQNDQVKAAYLWRRWAGVFIISQARFTPSTLQLSISSSTPLCLSTHPWHRLP